MFSYIINGLTLVAPFIFIYILLKTNKNYNLESSQHNSNVETDKNLLISRGGGPA